MTVRISISVEMILSGTPFLEKVSTVAKDGFKAVEFWGWKDKNIDGLKTTCQKTGITVSNFSGHRKFSSIYSEHKIPYISEVKESIKVAKKLGCKNLMLLTDELGETGTVVSPGHHLTEEEKYANTLSALTELAEIAEAENIFLHLEPLNTHIDHKGYFMDSPRKAFRLIREVRSPNIKVLYDVYHMQIMSGNVIPTLKENVEYVGYIHFADVPGRHEPETGELNFGEILRELEMAGYSGYVGMEFKPLSDWNQAAKIIRKYI